MTDVQMRAYQKLLSDLSKLELKARDKAEKERQKMESKSIIFKGVECFTSEDIVEIYGVGECTIRECDKAIEKLKNKKNQDVNDKTLHEYYSDLLLKITSDIAEEIRDEKKNK